eukprot:PhF_6_TR5625/c1_g2_i2/m.8167
MESKPSPDDVFRDLKMVDDTDGEDVLIPSLLMYALQLVGLNPSYSDLENISSAMEREGTTKSDRLTFTVFQEYIKRLQHTIHTTDYLVKCFKVFNVSGNGVLTFEELKAALQSNGESLSDEEVEGAMITAGGTRQHGIVIEDIAKAICPIVDVKTGMISGWKLNTSAGSSGNNLTSTKVLSRKEKEAPIAPPAALPTIVQEEKATVVPANVVSEVEPDVVVVETQKAKKESTTPSVPPPAPAPAPAPQPPVVPERKTESHKSLTPIDSPKVLPPPEVANRQPPPKTVKPVKEKGC